MITIVRFTNTKTIYTVVTDCHSRVIASILVNPAPCMNPHHLLRWLMRRLACGTFRSDLPLLPEGDKMCLNKDEVRPILARARVVHVHPRPPPVAPGADHVLEPGHLAIDAMTRAAVAKMRSTCLRLTGDADFSASSQGFGFFAPSAARHRLVNFEHHTVLVRVLLLRNEVLEVGAHLVLLALWLLLALAVLARQQHSSLSKSRLVVPGSKAR